METMITFYIDGQSQTMEKSRFIKQYPNMAEDLLKGYAEKKIQEAEEHERYEKMLKSMMAKIHRWNKKAKYHPINRGTLEVYLTEGMEPNYPDPW